jgi:putative RecB family exonuclease
MSTDAVEEPVERLPYAALSPSRAGDFRTCPLLFRLRVLDRLPEAASVDASRGTVVHKVLELLFDLPAAERTPEAAAALLPAAWDQVRAVEPERTELFEPDDAEAWAGFWTSCRRVLARYFDLEDPTVLEPAGRELVVAATLPDGFVMRGVIDRVDVAPDGAVRINDYKTSRSPGETYEATALFQLRFYAAVLHRLHGVVPAVLRLLYLGNGETLSYSPDLEDLAATERTVLALRDAIKEAYETGDWQARPSAMCGWCSFQALCPAYGGTPPPLPARVPVSRAAAPVPPA